MSEIRLFSYIVKHDTGFDPIGAAGLRPHPPGPRSHDEVDANAAQAAHGHRVLTMGFMSIRHRRWQKGSTMSYAASLHPVEAMCQMRLPLLKARGSLRHEFYAESYVLFYDTLSFFTGMNL
jgi:purine nucleoside phosphorylase